MHPLTMRLVQNFIGINTTIRGICFWTYGIFSSFTVCWLLSYVPVINNTINLNWMRKVKKLHANGED